MSALCLIYFLITWVGLFVLYVWITDHIWAASRYIKGEEDEHGNPTIVTQSDDS